MLNRYEVAAERVPGMPVPDQPGFTFNDDGHPVDRFGRYGIAPRGSDKLIGHTRVTTYISKATKSYNLDTWRDNWLTYACATENGWQEAFRQAFERAQETDDRDAAAAARREMSLIRDYITTSAGMQDKADYGTVMHALTQDSDEGYLLRKSPDLDTPTMSSLNWNQRRLFEENIADMFRDLDAYRQVIEKHHVKFTTFEPRVVCDQLTLTGTPDRIAEIDGNKYIWDLKTGSQLDPLKLSAQMAVYAKSEFYSLDTAERARHHASDVDGYVIHVPARRGKATISRVNLMPGWHYCNVDLPAVLAAHKLRRKEVIEPVEKFDARYLPHTNYTVKK